MQKYDKRLLELAGAQHFVVGREQLLELGSPRQVQWRMQTGLLERVYESVYRIAASPSTWKQTVMAATFAGGKFSVASFRTAAQLRDLPAGQEVCEITSPRHRRARHDGVIPHESRFMSDRDITYLDNIPVTRAARMMNDLGLLVCRGELSVDTYDHTMLEAVRRDLVDVPQVWAEWERLGGVERPGGLMVERMLNNFIPPSSKNATTPELRLLQIVRAAGLPEPVLQFRVWLSPTRWVDLDLAWPEFEAWAEFDPYKWHGNRDAYMKTIARRLEVESKLKWRGVPVTDDELDAGCPLVIPILADLLTPQ